MWAGARGAVSLLTLLQALLLAASDGAGASGGGKACIYRANGAGECVDISARCLHFCPGADICALDLAEQLACLPASADDFKNCGSEAFRLSQPCPADAGIRGFGPGCTYCVGGNPFLPLLPAVSARISQPKAERACVFIHTGNGNFKRECQDISQQCAEKNCSEGTICGLNLKEQIECFLQSVTDFQNCRSEEFRLSQPCPADAGIRGFGQGCTYCVGGNPFLPPSPTVAARISQPKAERACVFIHTGNGNFKRECQDISQQCVEKNCSGGAICGLNLEEQIECFPQSVTDFQNCGSEESRLSQPCPADAGIRGFGQGCTFCVGGNPFSPPEPEPSPRASDRACVVIHTGGGNFKTECVDISQQCAQKNCPSNTICALDLDENIQCFPDSVRDLENCAPEDFRLSQPCPADTGIVGFGQGCTFCTADDNPFEPPEPVGRACLVTGAGENIRRECVDIAPLCALQQCPAETVCGLDLTAQPQCFPVAVTTIQNCGPEQLRLSQPCPADTTIIGFGQGCTFCSGERPTEPPVFPRACIVAHVGGGQFKRQCVDISDRCVQQQCPVGTICGLNLRQQIHCFPASVTQLQNCATEQQRLQQPCPAQSRIRGFGPGCTFCMAGGAVPVPTQPPPPATGRACVSRHIGNGRFRRGCRDISAQCARLGCPAGSVCALSVVERPICVPLTRVGVRHCTAERMRVLRPCPPNSVLQAYGQGCNYCQQPRRPRPDAAGRVCLPAGLNVGRSSAAPQSRAVANSLTPLGQQRASCFSIAAQCRQKRCLATHECGLNRRLLVVCHPRSLGPRQYKFCGSEAQRIQAPCGPHRRYFVDLLGAGCNICRRL